MKNLSPFEIEVHPFIRPEPSDQHGNDQSHAYRTSQRRCDAKQRGGNPLFTFERCKTGKCQPNKEAFRINLDEEKASWKNDQIKGCAKRSFLSQTIAC